MKFKIEYQEDSDDEDEDNFISDPIYICFNCKTDNSFDIQFSYKENKQLIRKKKLYEIQKT